ncbi:MAG TPA: SpoIVB peptidase S55 domain-containing protein [Pyrinomonadaceae bacterium]|nr:SpoIVB peptidase S55 domain-containing protein [Pyrinomonadaceae bacterium]
MKRNLFALFALTILLSVPAFAQKPAEGAKTPVAFFPLEEIKVGQKGVARTVFAGTETQEFGVEVLGVMPGYPQPRQSAIIVRLSGANVERTGVFGGMSGSPVYIEGKLVGAIAFTFNFAKEPIAGITPIKQMIDIFERGAAQRSGDGRDQFGFLREPRAVTYSQLSGTDWKFELPQNKLSAAPFIAPVATGSPLAALLGQQFAPISTPVVFSGFTADALARFSTQLQGNGLLPVSGMGGASPITPMGKVTDKTLLPGSSISVQLVRGDFSVAASGTVTYRDGDRVYAFGHPFLNLGSSDMPMSEASVVTVIPNTLNSFKLTVPGQMVGAVSQDRAPGVYGQLGRAPKMIPVRVNLHTSRERVETYNYEVASDEFLTPILLNMTVYNTITSSERSLGDSTISVKGTIEVKGQKTVQLERRFSMQGAGLSAAGSVAAPVAALLSSGFDGVELGPITLDIAATDSRRAATLDRIALDRSEVRRGETVEVQAYVRTDSGKQFVQRIPVEIPSDIPPGQLILFVGDGGSLQQASATQGFVPKDLSQLVGAINKIKKNDRLYVKLFRITPGAVIGTDEMPNLPPSFVATLNSDRSTGGFTPTMLSPVDEKELPAAEYVISGQQLIAITVLR